MRTAATRAACLLVLLILVGGPARALAAPGLVVGVDDDTIKWRGRPNGMYSVYRDLGLGAVRITIPWQRGITQPTRLQQTYGHRIGLLLALGERVVLAVYGEPSQAPTTERWRRQYCSFVEHLVTRLPVRDVVIWNEVNSAAYWPRSSGAAGYERLLATCWDALHAHVAGINLITSTASHHDPAGFVRALGAAYHASRRTRPIADTFGHNPYPDYSAEPPSAVHEPTSGTVGEGDLPTLLAAYRSAFAGTAQQPPGVGGVTVWYLEDGFQTFVPLGKRGLYHGSENDRGPVHVPTQASQLRDALLLAYCQPAVGAFFNFELVDEYQLPGWQSGLLYTDGTRKEAYAVFRDTVTAIEAGAVDCSQVPGAG
jgi:hypothetical protein